MAFWESTLRRDLPAFPFLAIMSSLAVLPVQLFALAVRERSSAIDMSCGLSRASLPSADGQIAIPGINFYSSCHASCPLGSQKDRSATAEGVENEIAPTRTVPNRISNQADRFRRRVMSLLVGGVSGRCGVFPDVGARAAMLSELKIVDVLAA